MNPSDPFGTPEPVQALSEAIGKLVAQTGPLRLMHLCGSHEHALNQHGLRQLLPKELKIIPGPGCPVCVCPAEAIDQAIQLAKQPQTTLVTFGDMLRVPGSRQSLAQAKAEGASVRMVYSPYDCLKLAQEQPTQTLVFFAVGFETTMAGVAGLIAQSLPKNLYFLVAGRYMPPVLRLLMEIHDETIRGFLLPGHAAIITGLEPYRFMETQYKLPSVVAGFEPADVLLGIWMLLKEIAQGTAGLKNAYPRAVRDEGNLKAQAWIAQVFDLKPGVWRGIDLVEDSAFVLREAYRDQDALRALNADPGFPAQGHPPGCQCHRIMLGEKQPTDCGHFGQACNPQNPIGPCMVSPEGTCNSWSRFGIRSL